MKRALWVSAIVAAALVAGVVLLSALMQGGGLHTSLPDKVQISAAVTEGSLGWTVAVNGTFLRDSEGTVDISQVVANGVQIANETTLDMPKNLVNGSHFSLTVMLRRTDNFTSGQNVDLYVVVTSGSSGYAQLKLP